MDNHSSYIDILSVGSLHEAIARFSKKDSVIDFWQEVALSARWVIPARRTCILSTTEEGTVETIARVERGKVLPLIEDSILLNDDCIAQILQDYTPRWFETFSERLKPIDTLRRWLIGDSSQVVYAMPLSIPIEKNIIVILFDLIPNKYRTDQTQITALASLYAQHAATTYAVVKSTVELIEKNHQLESTKSELIKVSRQAGMAEIATGVLHNIGNVLNSVNVSANLLEEKIHASNVDRLPQISELLKSNLGGLDDFLENDPKGQRILPYLRELGTQISNQNAESMIELESLKNGIVHIKSVISSQQSFAKPVGIIQLENLVELIDDALEMSDLQIRGLKIEVTKNLQVLERVDIDRHRVIQILLNLLSNAKQAMLGAQQDPNLKIVLERKDEKSYLISVTDNGVGIDQNKMDNIFSHGFTTKPDGHGFGLHNSALAAIDMNGSLQCDSAGTNQGATFTLVLPLDHVDKRESQRYDDIIRKK